VVDILLVGDMDPLWTKSAIERSELKVIAEGFEPIVEYVTTEDFNLLPIFETLMDLYSVVFVSDLNCSFDSLWTWEDSDQNWPQQQLATDLPKARLLSYNYQAQSPAREPRKILSLIEDLATDLNNKMEAFRKDGRTPNRAIAFVAQRFGRLICQYSLVNFHVQRFVAGYVFFEPSIPHTPSFPLAKLLRGILSLFGLFIDKRMLDLTVSSLSERDSVPLTEADSIAEAAYLDTGYYKSLGQKLPVMTLCRKGTSTGWVSHFLRSLDLKSNNSIRLTRFLFFTAKMRNDFGPTHKPLFHCSYSSKT
jgi:hypothetical protein